MSSSLTSRIEPISDGITAVWVRWRRWRLRHPLPLEITAVMLGLITLAGGVGGDEPAADDTSGGQPVVSEIPDGWVVLALDAPNGLSLHSGDAVAILADGGVIAADAIVTETGTGETITIALPLASAGAVASVHDIAVIARTTD